MMMNGSGLWNERDDVAEKREDEAAGCNFASNCIKIERGEAASTVYGLPLGCHQPTGQRPGRTAGPRDGHDMLAAALGALPSKEATGLPAWSCQRRAVISDPHDGISP